nr:PREDICTED: DNA repair protein UVH3-like [Musa acuminata subsp. malaccensis]
MFPCMPTRVLASRGVGNSENGDHYSLAKQSTSNSAKCSLLSSQHKLVKEVSISKRVKDFGPDVETYCDENGLVRVSRVKGLGIRMTRDLQRNLDLMEKYEQEKRRGDNSSDRVASHTKKVVDVSKGLSGNNHSPSVASNEGIGVTFTEKSSSLPLDRRGYMDELAIHGSEDAIVISFSEDDSGKKATDDDNIFMQLIFGGQKTNLPLECVHSDKSTNESESDCSWEEGLVKEISEIPNSFADITSSYEVADVDWEKGVCQNPDTSSQFLDKPVKDVSRGMLQEEADIQEAIRRSPEDFKEQNSSTNSSAVTKLMRSVKDQISDGVILHKLVTNTCVHLGNDAEESPSCNDGQLDNRCKEDDLQIPDSSKNNLDSYNLSGLDLDGESSLLSRREDEQNVMTSQRGNIPPCKPSDGHPKCPWRNCVRSRPNTSTKITDDGSEVVVGSSNRDSRHLSRSSVSPERGYNNSLSGNSSLMEEIIDTGMKSQQNIAEKDNTISDHIGYSTQILNNQMEVSEASLDKEISLLRQERVNLGNEQRMLERDAECVNNEITEAQCAYIEMTDLVDGVVTNDSYVFLFGARSVYKYIIDDRKYVETYFVKGSVLGKNDAQDSLQEEEYKPENSTGGNSKRGKKVPRQWRGQKTEKEFIYSEDLAGESLVLVKDDIDDTSVLSLNRTVKGRRGRGRGARGRGKGRGRSSPIKVDSDSTDDGDDYNANVQLENHSKVPEVLPKLRSGRKSKEEATSDYITKVKHRLETAAAAAYATLSHLALCSS